MTKGSAVQVLFLVLPVAAALGLVSCTKRQVVNPPPQISVAIFPSKDLSEGAMSAMEGILTDYGFLAVERVMLSSVFEGLEVPPSGPLDPGLAHDISWRSRAQVLILVDVSKNREGLDYINGAYSLSMQWIDLPSGKVLVAKKKALYFAPRVDQIKEVMQACLEIYRAEISPQKQSSH